MSRSGGGDPLAAVGEWAITPEVHFSTPDPYAQSSFEAGMPTPSRMVVAEIVDVVWEGKYLGDGKTNLSDDNPTDLGDGWRFFYGMNYFNPDGETHDEVEVVVHALPNLAGIPIKARFVDADDPTDHDGPIDDDTGDATDNRETVTWERAGTTTTDAQNAQVTFTLATPRNPGDNFRVIAGGDNRTGFALIKPIFDTESPETEGRLYADIAGTPNNEHDPEEPILTEENAVEAADNRFLATPLLTVWRRLHVEVDSMGAPDPNINYGFDGDEPVDDPDPDPDDTEDPGVIGDPDISAFGPAFRPAFIEMLDPRIRSGWNQAGLRFERQFPNPRDTAGTYFLTGADPARQTQPEQDDYWSVYVAGVYEMFPQTVNSDNDPHSEYAVLGWTPNAEPEYSEIPMEIIRDVATQWNWTPQQTADFNRIVSLHEIGHQFECFHHGTFLDHVMQVHPNEAAEAQLPQIPTVFHDDDIDRIRDHGTGSDPEDRRP